jgi:3-oxoacyl-(acyl-carrier-protein) synthase/thioesterase domain-containing protein/acyl carrier protein
MNKDDLENAIAIIGMSGKFPGADNVETFWKNLCDGKETISSFSDKALINTGLSKLQVNSPNYVKSRGVLNDIEFFDAEFFGLNIKEAQLTDPQHRIFLECAWEALENAGYCTDKYSGSIGVYGGSGISSYYLNNIHPNRSMREALGDFLLRIGNDKDYLTTRVSYKLNLKGPSIAIQTACSTSLVAVCIACDHLLTYQCDMALAGGVTISVPQSSGYLYQEGMILSKDGHCRPFDAEAKGTVMSNGVGLVVLKRYQDAIADKDHIYAVIRGYGINNDGSAKVGYSAPSVEGQTKAIASALAIAGVDPETISYVEAHGTGTVLGDPIEIQGLTGAFSSKKNGYCALGSVKSNIGHTVEAAGIIGLLKVVLSLYHKKIPPTLHFRIPNPHIDFANTPFYVNTALKEWESTTHPRRACVSSFGIGGTNAHAILEERPQQEYASPTNQAYPLIVSAKSKKALKIMARNLGLHLQKHPEFSLADVAYTLHVGRKLFEHKLILECRDREEAISLLFNFDPNNHLDTTAIYEEDFFKDKHCSRVPLPTYPFEKSRCWIDPPPLLEESSHENPQYTSIEAALIDILKEYLGIESIGMNDDFFQIGGDSILAVQIVESIYKQFNINIGIQTLRTHPTIAKLTKIVSDQKVTTSSLINLRPGSLAPPLFLIHPIEGNLFCYKGLIDELKCKNPLYGFQSVDTENKNIEKIASSYIEELRKVQAIGPYNLLGMSFGGIIAYEMAKQLVENNDSVALLFMVDVDEPNFSNLALLNENDLLIHLIELLEGTTPLDKKVNAEKIIQSLGLGKLSHKDQEFIFKVVKTHLSALAKYQPKPYPGKIYFFQASQRFFRRKNVSLGESWKELVNGKIEIQEIPGNHLSILLKPQVEKLAHYIDTRLQSVTARQKESRGS